MTDEKQVHIVPRGFFNDGWDSFWRLVAGIFASQLPSILVPVCLGIQVLSPDDSRIAGDMREFLVGYVVGVVLHAFVRVSILLT
jgi:hypothetical protein